MSPPKAETPRRAYWLTLVGSWILRILALTLRITVETPQEVAAMYAASPVIFTFWHNRLLLVPIVWNRYFRAGAQPGYAMASTSGDGELIAQFLARFGVGSVRGSSTRRGSVALRELVRGLRQGHCAGVTPDGSRGPLYEIKPGLVLLAQISGRPMVPINLEYSRAWRLKSWDRFFIPKPFSRVHLRLGPAHHVARTATPEAFEEERRRCQQAMMAIVSER